jgi:DNA-binding MarR family transcriptional regulator
MPDDAPDKSGAYVLDEQIGFLLRRAHQRATSIFAGNFGPLKLTPTQFTALAKIADRGSVSQNHLGRMTAMDPATMKGVIDRLLDRGLITRNPDPDDRRRAVLELTDTGLALLQEAVPKGFSTTEETLAPLTADERLRFLALLKKIS